MRKTGPLKSSINPVAQVTNKGSLNAKVAGKILTNATLFQLFLVISFSNLSAPVTKPHVASPATAKTTVRLPVVAANRRPTPISVIN